MVLWKYAGNYPPLYFGAGILMTLDTYSYRICWKHGGQRWIRRYFNSFENGSMPTNWELTNLAAFLRYETSNDRNIALWFASEKICDLVIEQANEGNESCHPSMSVP